MPLQASIFASWYNKAKKATQPTFINSESEYTVMNNFYTDEIEQVIKSVPTQEITPELSSVIFCLGRDAENEEEYDYAFSKLLELYERENDTVKACVIQAFSMIAILKKDIKILDRSIVEPLVLSARSNAVGTNKATIEDAIGDINFSLNWNI